MNKKQQVVALTLAITLLLSGCSGLTIGSSEKHKNIMFALHNNVGYEIC